jgi:hypothetical protein
MTVKTIARHLGLRALKLGRRLQPQAKSRLSSNFRLPTNPQFDLECLVGFFGLNRSLDITSGSINANIFAPLDKMGFATVSVGHLNLPSVIHSPRSGERMIAAANLGIDNIDFELIWQEPQSDSAIEPLASNIYANYPMRGEDDNDRFIRRNALLQMHSQTKLLAILQLMNLDRFKVFCFSRPDLLFLDELPYAAVVAIQSGELDLVTPAWHRWGGLNDRFALCSARGAQVYLNRLSWVQQFCAEKGYFHPEEILSYSAKRSGLNCGFMPTRARRVRATGLIVDEDFEI